MMSANSRRCLRKCNNCGQTRVTSSTACVKKRVWCGTMRIDREPVYIKTKREEND